LGLENYVTDRRPAVALTAPPWRWYLDEVFVKINGKLCYLWRAVDHEGEVLEAVVTASRDKAVALKLLKRIIKKYGRLRIIVTDRLRVYSAAMNEIGVADRHEVQQSGGEFSSTDSTTRTSDAAISKYVDATEVQLSSRPSAKPLQSGTLSRRPTGLQAETFNRIGRVAGPRLAS
jgi:IS1 family transposase